jgi:choline dehydrogenase
LSDYNAQTYNGFVRIQSTISGGERQSAYRSFIVAAMNRTNFFVMKNAMATQVIFSGTKAIGVKVKTNELLCPSITINAAKEVILSSGALGTPKILQQSGVGLAADLPAGIAVKSPLPVGRNFQDHVLSTHFIKVNPNAPPQSVLDLAYQLMEYYYNRTGDLTQVGIMNSEGFIHTTNTSAKYPDIQNIFYKFPKNQPYMANILANFGLKDAYANQLVVENANFEIIMGYNILLNPKSRGSYKISSATNFDAAPTINANFFSDPADVDTVVRGINKMQALFNTAAMQPSSPSFVKFDIAECNSIAYPSDNYWKCYIKHFSHSLWHPAGTCKMGPVADASTVVDPTLKLKGFTNIRVADASIMPTVSTGNTQCPTYAIGQKAYELINAANP